MVRLARRPDRGGPHLDAAACRLGPHRVYRPSPSRSSRLRRSRATGGIDSKNAQLTCPATASCGNSHQRYWYASRPFCSVKVRGAGTMEGVRPDGCSIGGRDHERRDRAAPGRAQVQEGVQPGGACQRIRTLVPGGVQVGTGGELARHREPDRVRASVRREPR